MAAPSPSLIISPPLARFARIEQWWRHDRALVVAMVLAAVLVLARSAVFLWWEQAGFDSDQAIFGLMAKHIAEGRAFPLFIYGAPYMLGVQAWLAAPLFAIFGPSVAILKIPVVLVNLATAVLLVWILCRDGGLRPAVALLASSFYVLAPPALAASLVETGGGNPEPFLYVLLLWLLRGRPLAFGMVFGLGFLHREFTLYGVTAIAGLALLGDWRLTPARWRAMALVGVGYLIVWQLVRIGFLFASPSGPGTVIAAPLGADQNLQALASRWCWAPAAIAPGVGRFFGNFLGIMYGADNHRLTEFGIRSALRSALPGLPGFWPVLGVVFSVAMVRVLWIAASHRLPLWRGRPAFASFLILVGLQAGLAYTAARCGVVEVGTARYALLSVYTGLGIVALFLVCEPQRAWRATLSGAILAWGLTSVTGHARLVREYVDQEPQNSRRELATYLVTNGIQYARADYWTAYATTFLARERVVVASTDLVRIDEYQRRVEANRADAVTVQATPCQAAGGSEAVPGMYWVCPE